MLFKAKQVNNGLQNDFPQGVLRLNTGDGVLKFTLVDADIILTLKSVKSLLSSGFKHSF